MRVSVRLNSTSLIKFLIFIYIFATLVWSTYSETRGLYYISALVLGISLLLDMFIRHVKFLASKYHFAFALFLLMGLVSIIWSTNRANTMEQCQSLMINFLFSALILNYILNNQLQLDYIKTICAVGICMSLYLLMTEGISTIFYSLSQGLRIGKSLGNENVLGVFSAISATISLFYIKYEKKNYHWLFLPITSFVSLGSGSRMAFIILLIGLVGIYVLNMSLRNAAVLIIRIIAVLAIIYLIINLPIFFAVKNRVLDLVGLVQTHDTANRSLTNRSIMIQRGIEGFLNQPFTGVGLGNTGVLIRGFTVGHQYFYLHNNYIELLASIGVFGFLSYYSIYYYGIKNIINILKNEKDNVLMKLIILICILMLINEFSNITYYKSIYFSLFIIPYMFIDDNRKEISSSKSRR